MRLSPLGGVKDTICVVSKVRLITVHCGRIERAGPAVVLLGKPLAYDRLKVRPDTHLLIGFVVSDLIYLAMVDVELPSGTRCHQRLRPISEPPI